MNSHHLTILPTYTYKIQAPVGLLIRSDNGSRIWWFLQGVGEVPTSIRLEPAVYRFLSRSSEAFQSHHLPSDGPTSDPTTEIAIENVSLTLNNSPTYVRIEPDKRPLLRSLKTHNTISHFCPIRIPEHSFRRLRLRAKIVLQSDVNSTCNERRTRESSLAVIVVIISGINIDGNLSCVVNGRKVTHMTDNEERTKAGVPRPKIDPATIELNVENKQRPLSSELVDLSAQLLRRQREREFPEKIATTDHNLFNGPETMANTATEGQ